MFEQTPNLGLSILLRHHSHNETYLSGKYAAHFINRFDLNQNLAEADVYTLAAGKLTRKTVLVFKKGTNPITDLDVV